MAKLEEKVLEDWLKEVFARQRKKLPQVLKEPIAARKARLKKLRAWILENRPAITKALYDDFKKPTIETEAVEIFPVLDEIKLALSNLREWTAPKKIDAPITMLGTRSWIHYEAKGVCLILAPWNYPFSLCVGPLVSALAAGNCVVMKPSEHTPHTSSLLKKMCETLFDEDEVAVCEGGPEISQQLIHLPFDHIFFTGSPAIGKVVMKAAAENLTSVTLELGGKSPTIVTTSAKIKEAAKRIAVAKFINNGQTCIAPDYILVQESIRDPLVAALKAETQKLFQEKGKLFQQSPHYARMVNDNHYNRVSKLIEDAIEKGAELAWSGNSDQSDRFIHPVILTDVPENARVMEEEIFGPVLPIVSYQSLDEAIVYIRSKPKPLALYIFGSDKKEHQRITHETSSGAVCVNDCAVHFLHHNLPFGGVNNSGIGKAHGHYGFLAFSNEKPVLRQRNGMTTLQFFYPPYTPTVQRFVNWLLRLF